MTAVIWEYSRGSVEERQFCLYWEGGVNVLWGKVVAVAVKDILGEWSTITEWIWNWFPCSGDEGELILILFGKI